VALRSSLVISLSVYLVVGAVSIFAQTPPATPTLQNQPSPASQPVASDSFGVSGSLSSGAAVTPTQGIGSIPSSSRGKSFGSVGRGLPGMPGGPPLKSTLGAQDPSGTFMRPFVIPPVLCDPAVDLPC